MTDSANNKRKTRAIIYTRVSTDEQAETGYSLRDQEARLKRYCRIHACDVIAHFQDQEGDREQEAARVRTDIAKVDDRLFDVDEKFIEGSLAQDSYERLKGRYVNRKRELEKRERDPVALGIQPSQVRPLRYLPAL